MPTPTSDPSSPDHQEIRGRLADLPLIREDLLDQIRHRRLLKAPAAESDQLLGWYDELTPPAPR